MRQPKRWTDVTRHSFNQHNAVKPRLDYPTAPLVTKVEQAEIKSCFVLYALTESTESLRSGSRHTAVHATVDRDHITYKPSPDKQECHSGTACTRIHDKKKRRETTKIKIFSEDVRLGKLHLGCDLSLI